MRSRSSKVSVLNKITKQSLQKIVLRDTFGGFVHLGFQEKILQALFKIKEGTIFAIEHHTTSGPRMILEKFKKEGFVRTYGEGPQFADYPKFNHVSVGFEAVEGDERTKQMSWGFSFAGDGPEIALYKGLIEAVERHANYFAENSKTIYYPTFFYGDASWLYPLVPHPRAEQMERISVLASSSEDLKCVRGFKAKSLLTGKKKFFPLQVFYFGIDLLKEKLLGDLTTSGTGAGSSFEMATLSALYELIERDHFHLYWFAGVTPTLVDISSDVDLFRKVSTIRSRYNLEVYIFDISYDYGTQVYMSVIIDPVLHIVSCGAKAGQFAQNAIEGALLESLAVLNSLRETNGFFSEKQTKDFLASKTYLSQKMDKSARLRVFSNEYGISFLKKSFLFKNNKTVSLAECQKRDKVFPSLKKELAFITSLIKEKMKKEGDEYDVFIHELSSKYSKEIELSVVHVFSPALLKLHLMEMFSSPVSSRLFKFAKLKGKKSFQEKDINPLPHFFP